MALKPEPQRPQSGLPTLKDYHKAQSHWRQFLREAAVTVGAASAFFLVGCGQDDTQHTNQPAGTPPAPNSSRPPIETNISGTPPVSNLSQTDIGVQTPEYPPEHLAGDVASPDPELILLPGEPISPKPIRPEPEPQPKPDTSKTDINDIELQHPPLMGIMIMPEPEKDTDGESISE